MSTILFLCTGNFYRSRFAEELFNHHASISRLGWRALSRGQAIDKGSGNVGPVSAFAAEALSARDVRTAGLDRYPQQCFVSDLEAANLIVALDETERRPLMLERYVGWHDRATYWHVQDVGACAPPEALASIESEVGALMGMSRPLLNLAGRALPVDDAMRLLDRPQVSVRSCAWHDVQLARL